MIADLLEGMGGLLQNSGIMNLNQQNKGSGNGNGNGGQEQGQNSNPGNNGYTGVRPYQPPTAGTNGQNPTTNF